MIVVLKAEEMAQVFDKDSIDVVLHHGGCPDGFGSAMVVNEYYKAKFGKERAEAIEYIGCGYSDPYEKFSTRVKDKNVLICDFSFKNHIFQKMLADVKSVFILDHHKTAEIELANVPDCYKIFDMKRSGATITWSFFYPDTEPNLFVKYLEDIDLWTKKLPNCEEFTVSLSLERFQFSAWEPYFYNPEALIERGKHCVQHRDDLVNRLMDHAYIMDQTFDGKQLRVVYLNFSEIRSELGNQLLKAYPEADFSVVYYYQGSTNNTVISLRSMNEKEDVRLIAEAFGGGGHRNASGLELTGFHTFLPLADSSLSQGTMERVVRLSHPVTPNLAYQAYLLRMLVQKAWMELIDINDEYYNMVTVHSSHFQQEMFDELKKAYPRADLIVVNGFDGEDSVFHVEIYTPNLSMKLITDQFEYHYLDKENNIITIHGAESRLPLTPVNHPTLLAIMREDEPDVPEEHEGHTHYISSWQNNLLHGRSKMIIQDKEQHYLLINITPDPESKRRASLGNLRGNASMNILRRVFPGYMFIIFMEVKQNETLPYTYEIHFNPYSLNDAEKQFWLMNMNIPMDTPPTDKKWYEIFDIIHTKAEPEEEEDEMELEWDNE